MPAAGGGGEAPDAAVTTTHEDPGAARAYVEQLEYELDLMKERLDGVKSAMASKRDELKAARAAVREG